MALAQVSLFTRLSLVLVVVLLDSYLVAGDECQPHQWKRAVGDIVCRYDTKTGPSVNYYTCKQIADFYGGTVEEFFFLNPSLNKDCSNIQPNTTYCVEGYIERPVAVNGKCGPPNKNATCAGTEKQCCNSETWTCGSTEQDCAPGTCYEGACPDASEYSLEGKCGPKNGNLKCGGKWGDCCNFDGVCGTGDAFCGKGHCESGNCTAPDPGNAGSPTTPGLPWQTGTTPNGTCGGTENYTCDIVYGVCCSASGTCSSDQKDCGENWVTSATASVDPARQSTENAATAPMSSSSLILASFSALLVAQPWLW